MNEDVNHPFLLKPAGKDYLWGGSRLNDDFAKGIEMSPLAETWECSTHPEGQSVVASGSFEGQGLTEVLKKHPEYLGTHPKKENGLPILIKFIDARENLSVQVHPDDKYAGKYENGSLGKTEMWYVLDASRNAQVVYGFYHPMDKEKLTKSLKDGTIEKYLRKVPVKKNDVFYIPAGLVHAIGGGALVAEIQENSNVTYRLYDYKRADKNGKQRELHIEKALDVADLSGSEEPGQPMRVLNFHRGYATEILCRCKYFLVERLLLNTEIHRQLAVFQAGTNSFWVLLCVDGCGTLFMDDNCAVCFFKGDCMFVPAGSEPFRIHGKGQLLKVSC